MREKVFPLREYARQDLLREPGVHVWYLRHAYRTCRQV